MTHQFITQSTLEALGFDLSGEDVEALLDHLNETLQERVGVEIAESLNEKQLAILVDLQEKASETDLGAWLEENVPDLDQIVQNEIDILIGEIADTEDEKETE